MKKNLLVLFPLLIFLAACGPDPRDTAEAYAIQAQADQDTADRIQARQQAAEDHAMGTAARERLIYWASVTGSFSLGLLILSLGLGLSWAAIGTGKALARLALVRSNLIPLDHETRQYPLLLSYIGRGRYSLANPNTGNLVYLDTRRDEDRQLITASSAVQLAGIVTREARKSKDPAGVSVYQPVLVGGEHESVLSTSPE